MKAVRLLAIAALATASLSSPVAPALAQDSNNQGANAELLEYCTALVASGDFPGLNFGECMSFNRTSEHGFTAHFCDLLREQDLYEDFGVTSYSDCIRNISF